MSHNHEKYIKRCLQLAKNGIGTTRPNPSVGAVVVYNDTIIGEGYTSPYGGSHAEVNAINSVQKPELLEESTIYVTMEPCSHYGKTPPCADLIVTKKIPNVVIGCVDTNSLVSGKGIERLQKAGCNVIVGVLEKECLQHHKRFFSVQEKKRPYIILKWAETVNGYIAPSTKKELKPVWISNVYSQQLAHKWRSEEHAILVGTNTALHDNPNLNVRSWTGNNPVRVLLDRKLRVSNTFNILDNSIQTLVLTEKKEFENKEFITYETINFKEQVAKQICEILMKHKIQSVLIEGGLQTLQTFIDEDLWDEARVFVGQSHFDEGIKSPDLLAKQIIEEKIDNDILRIYTND